MALAPETRACGAVIEHTTLPPGRVIVVGIRDHDHDAATIRWAECEAVSGADAVHLVHAYVPLRLDGCTWDPVRRERDVRAMLSKRITAQAVQRIRAARPDLLIDGSSVQGLPADVLHEFSSVADLLVVGDDTSRPRHAIAWRVQEHAHCPVVRVPRGFRAPGEGPVTVVVHGQPAEPAMRFAADAARRHNAALEVCDVERKPDSLPGLAAGSRLLVAPRSAAALLRALGGAAQCPVAVVAE